MSRGSSSGHHPPPGPDDAADDIPAEGTVMDANMMAELEAAAAQRGQPGGFAAARDESGMTLDPSDIVEEGDEEVGGPSTDQHALPDEEGYGTPVGPPPDQLPVTHRPTEQLAAAEAASQYPPQYAPAPQYAPEPQYAPAPPADEPPPLTAQPTMIYRDPAPAQARVLVVGGNDRGREFELTSDEVSIGRGADCDIVLADIAVSRRHLVLFRDGVVYRCRDQRSGNGTTVNGRKVEEVLLSNGDTIEIGNTALRFVMTGDAYVAAAPVPAGPPPGYTPATAPPPSAYGAPPYGGGFGPPPGAPGVATVAPAPYPEGDPFAQAAQSAAQAASAYTPIVSPRGQQKKQRVAPPAGGGGPLTRLTATRQGKLITFGSIGLAFLLVCSAFVKRVILPKRRPVAVVMANVPAAPAAEASYEDGVKKFRDGDWEAAKASFDAVLVQVPDFQGAKKYAERCDAEIKSRDQLAQAKAALEKNDFAGAKAALKEVDPAAKVGDEGTKLGRAVPQKQIEFLLAAAKKLQTEEDFPGAKAKVEEALAVQPDHAEAVALRAELEKAKPKTEKEKRAEAKRAAAAERAAAREKVVTDKRSRAEIAKAEREEKKRKAQEAKAAKLALKTGKEPPVKPGKEPPVKPGKEPPVKPAPPPPEEKVQASGPVSDKVAMQHYRAREWGMAMTTLKQLAAKQKGKQASKTLGMAEDIRKVGQTFNRAEAAAGSNPASAVGLYEQAASLDRKVGKGAHGPYLSGKLNKLSRAEAQKALQSGRYEQAYSLVKTAQRYGGDDAVTRGVSSGLDNKAKELFERAYQMKGQKPDESKGLWRRVLKMVPSSSQWYAKSYKYLNETAGARPKDEDE